MNISHSRTTRLLALLAVGSLAIAGCGSSGAAGDSIADEPGMATTGGMPAAGDSSTAADDGQDSGDWSDTGKKVDVMGWSAGDEVATARVDFVKDKAPELDVAPDDNGFDQQKFATSMGGGTVPAGVSMDRQLLATYAAKGFLQPLDGCIAAQDIDMDQFYPDSVKESSWDGHVYGIPEFFTTRAVYVNQDALDDAGVSADDIKTSDWDALSTLAGKLYQDADGKPSRIGFDPKVPEFLPLWVMAEGGNIVADDGSPTLDDQKVVDALTWAVAVINAQGGWADFKSFRDSWDFFGAENEFVKDQIGVMPFEQWYVNVLSGTDAHFTVVPFLGQDGQPMTLETGSSLAIPTGSPNAGGMCQFIKLITSTDAWMAAAAARDDKVKQDDGTFTGIFSANKTANDEMRTKYVVKTDNPDLDQAIATFYDSLDGARMIPPSPAGQQIQEAYQKAVTAALGGTDPAEALKAAQQTAMQAYEDATS